MFFWAWKRRNLMKVIIYVRINPSTHGENV